MRQRVERRRFISLRKTPVRKRCRLSRLMHDLVRTTYFCRLRCGFATLVLLVRLFTLKLQILVRREALLRAERSAVLLRRRFG